MPIQKPDNKGGYGSVIDPIALDNSKIYWRPTGDADNPACRLLASVTLGGAGFHLEAIEVRRNALDADECGDHDNDQTLEGLYRAVGNDGGPFEWVEIEGRNYIVFMTPYQR